MKEQWNKDIHDRLKDFPKKAPEGLLDDIQSEMLRRGLSPTPMPRKNKYIFLRIASAAAVLLILLGISHLWERQPIVHPEEHIFVPTAEEAILPVFAEEEENEQESTPTTPVIHKVMAEAQTPVSHPDTLASEKENVVSETKEEKSQENIQEERKKEVEEQPVVPTREERKKSFTPIRRKTSSFALGAYYSGLVAQAGISSGEYLNMNPSNPLRPDDYNSSDSTNVSSRAFSRSRSDNGVKHHLPVRAGISFRYSLDEHWSIQSGLTYSYLATDITRNNYQKKQALHYIGIPIQIGYQVWENKHFKSYLSAGVQMEKLVSGKVMTHYWGGNSLQGNATERISDKRLLFSALASIGAEYALIPNFSLYVEPGIHYYFDNGNGLDTHYNDQPLNFNITVGIRFHWKR